MRKKNSSKNENYKNKNSSKLEVEEAAGIVAPPNMYSESQPLDSQKHLNYLNTEYN
jgi:hypothetical protein